MLRALGILALVCALGFIGLLALGLFISSSSGGNGDYLTIEGAKDEVRRIAKDPESVEFRDVWIGELQSTKGKQPKRVACGHFNARNSYGAYSGFQKFIGGEGWVVTQESGGDSLESIWGETCGYSRG